jgi:hypothetical protein
MVFFMAMVGLSFGADEIGVEFGVMPEAVVSVARKVVNEPLGVRMAAVSEPFLGFPYLVGGHGEGLPPDTDPPARYDTFDCLTFLEEVLALSLAGDPVGVPALRDALRYRDGQVGYTSRHHFMMSQWVPKNIDAGFLKDITPSLGETHRVEKVLSPQIWANWHGVNALNLQPEDLPVGHFGLNVLSLDAAEAALDRIPPGAIILTIRQPKDWKPIVVSHVGFVLPRKQGEGVRVRHSTRTGTGLVRDHFLGEYLERMRWYQRSVEGVTILMPLEQGPRRIIED